MNYLLLLFALPIATIILAAIAETILKNPFAVAAMFFAIYLVVAFAAFDATFLIFVILYTILALISAIVTRAILNLINNDDDDDEMGSGCGCQGNGNNDNIVSGCSGNRGYRYQNMYGPRR